ncbi:hypothetical protein NM208_g13627 [Fusarium decemcellulare]|uniref:Uncharacterized protein n=1 Tax=Fusarium decemcellulare TaxID=57161 RepID=A0ACC1RJ51_9HYPO|nr:hypothetical protein NM208_g13627 [Fusarium decemcellulare]
MDAQFHTAERLFNDILDQVPSKQFAGDDGHPGNWHKKKQLSLATQRLLENNRVTSTLDTDATSLVPHNNLRVTWRHFGHSPLQRGSTRFEIHLHQVTTCSHLRKLLLSQDVLNSAISCTSDAHGHLTHHATVDTAGESCYKSTVKTSLGRYSFRQEAEFYHLKAGMKYFAILFQPDNPSSLVVVSDTWTVCGDKCNQVSAGYRRSEKSYGNPMKSLDILTPRDWFEAANSTDGTVVMGVLKKEDETGSPRKRQRT